MIDLKTATKLPNFTALPFAESSPNQLELIEFVEGTPRQKGNTLVRAGCATTNERLRRWCIQNKKVTLPLNVIMVELTLGGSNAPICHGAGRRHQTLSDLVREIEYVDVNGELRTVSNPEHLRAASGCFGLMGVVTRITLEFSPMSYAEMAPAKIPVTEAVPPPPNMKDEDIPPALRKSYTPEEKARHQAAFEQHANSDFYCEWFWFPFSDNAWVNCWNDTSDSDGVVDYPDDLHIVLSFIQTFAMNVAQNSRLLLDLIEAVHLDEAAVTLISRLAMFAMPEKKVKTYVTDALHFQRAIQNVRVRDTEVEIPLMPKADKPDQVDYSTVQRAWWDAILLCYANSRECPQRFPLEMRIMSGSDVVMAPQRHNALGTCAIEVLTLNAVDKGLWTGYAQQVLDKWLSYTDAQGKPLKTRPHWAKEWVTYKAGGQPWVKKLKHETYRDEIREFREVLAAIGREQGWTLADLKRRFSNELFDELIFADEAASA